MDQHHADFILKRSLLVTWDEAKKRNSHVDGSPAENPSLNALPSLSEFTMVAKPESAVFINDDPGPESWWSTHGRSIVDHGLCGDCTQAGGPIGQAHAYVQRLDDAWYAGSG